MMQTTQTIAITRATLLRILRLDIVDEATNLFHAANYTRTWTAIIDDIFTDRCSTVPDEADSDAWLLHLGLLRNEETEHVFHAAAQPNLPLGMSIRNFGVRCVYNVVLLHSPNK